MFAPRRILVPTDFSDFSNEALKLACDIAERNKAKIYLLHVVGVVQRLAVEYSLDQQTIDNIEERSIAFSKDMMNKQIEKTVRSEDVEIIPEVRKGSPSEEILKEQRSNDMDLIVIASHGMTGFLDHLIGSVAEKVIKGAECPVMIVKRSR